jgi:carbamoyl-phosphate synthase large subunit
MKSPSEADDAPEPDQIRAALSKATPQRLLYIAQAFRHGMELSKTFMLLPNMIRGFWNASAHIVARESEIKKHGLPVKAEDWLNLKKMGFSDARLAKLVKVSESSVRRARTKHNVHPVYKRVDSCAAEIPSTTPYMYSCYEGDGLNPAECEMAPTDRKKVIILGGGPNRIGQGIEFDYCCVHASYSLKEAGYETIMVNCNPETVSTDYDSSDRLYFEPLTAEDVIELIKAESRNGQVMGAIVQLGGQTPLMLTKSLQEAGIPILGTDPDSIDIAEDRERFQKLLKQLKLKQPANALAKSVKDALEKAEELGFPIVIRPSYVLGGQGMEIVHSMEDLQKYIGAAVKVSGDSPVLLDRYLKDAVEVDVDVLSDGPDVYIAGIMEHIEEAGIHSGDSACVLAPPFPAL